MNRRTRLLVEALRRLPRPAQPSARYLAQVRRELPRGLARLLLGPVGAEVALRDITVPSTDTLLPARVYRPRSATDEALPLVVNLHGGGFVLGNLTAADWLCGQLAARAQVTVVSVGYRLAPEYPAPTPFLDAWTATRWVIENAGLVGGDPNRVTVLGESAGANLAALIALASRDEHRSDPTWPRLVGQILAYPAVDLTLSSPSVDDDPDAPMLRRRTLDWYGRLYLPQGLATSIAADDPRVSPIFAADHTDLPPALVLVAGQDPLRDDATRYAAVLEASGVPVTTRVFPDAIHGFLSIPHFQPDAHPAVQAIVTHVRAMSA
ncbi:MAG TPA: alpha/beta hydrolase [Propionibacteriaceae bacterium]|nr:alpha/beta hydrolase [Propionibacteriaceae bacterium]